MGTVRPFIGITMRHELETERFYLARQYGEAVAAGEVCGVGGGALLAGAGSPPR